MASAAAREGMGVTAEGGRLCAAAEAGPRHGRSAASGVARARAVLLASVDERGGSERRTGGERVKRTNSKRVRAALVTRGRERGREKEIKSE